MATRFSCVRKTLLRDAFLPFVRCLARDPNPVESPLPVDARIAASPLLPLPLVLAGVAFSLSHVKLDALSDCVDGEHRRVNEGTTPMIRPRAEPEKYHEISTAIVVSLVIASRCGVLAQTLCGL